VSGPLDPVILIGPNGAYVLRPNGLSVGVHWFTGWGLVISCARVERDGNGFKASPIFNRHYGRGLARLIQNVKRGRGPDHYYERKSK
jgi:hypothetical protein